MDIFLRVGIKKLRKQYKMVLLNIAKEIEEIAPKMIVKICFN